MKHVRDALCILWLIWFGNSGLAQEAVPEQVDRINQLIRANWQDYEIVPSAAATDYEYCRRVYLDILGRIPSLDELKSYAISRDRAKKQRLVHQLLFDDRFQDDFVRNWTTIWTNILIGRTVGQGRDRMVSREGMKTYLREVFRTNRPYDSMVRELISATGTNTPDSDQFNGAVNFLTGKLDEKAAQATAQTSRIFLGVQVQCTQCHNHPFNDWKQNQYWELNAFYRQAVALRRFERGSNDVRYVELTDQDFAGEDIPPRPEAGRTYYELRNGKLQAAQPAFFGARINPSGYLSDSNRRAQLAEFVSSSDLLPRAIVNRMWAHFLGHGFTKPIDDMGPHNPPSHPELLDYLADQLREHSFDLKQLMLWIALSEPYGLSSRITAKNEMDDPELGEPPQFSHFYIRQMTAEQLYESLLVATRADQADKVSKDQDKQRSDWLRQFTKAFGTDEGDEMTTFDGTIPQTLMMFNGDLMKQATNGQRGTFLRSILDSDKKRMQKVNDLYLAAVGRMPTRTERKAVEQLFYAANWKEDEALQDLWWALLNCNEFILNH